MSPEGVRGWTSTIEMRGTRLVLVRRATRPEYRARLMHAGDLLARVEHHGIEPFIEIADDSQLSTLVTGFVGERSLATDPPRHAAQLEALGNTLDTLLTEIHDLGITLGSITASSVVLTAVGQPVFCGFFDGHGRDDDDQRWASRRRADREALACTLTGCLSRCREATRCSPRGIRSRRRAARTIAGLKDLTIPRVSNENPTDPLTGASATWTVRQGDHPWMIASLVLAERAGHLPSDDEIAAYLPLLVEANTALMADPDLVYPGRTLSLP